MGKRTEQIAPVKFLDGLIKLNNPMKINTPMAVSFACLFLNSCLGISASRHEKSNASDPLMPGAVESARTSTTKADNSGVNEGIMAAEISRSIRFREIDFREIALGEAVQILNKLIRDQLLFLGHDARIFQITNNSFSETKISIRLVNVSIKTLLDVICEQSNLHFVYTSKGVVFADPVMDGMSK